MVFVCVCVFWGGVFALRGRCYFLRVSAFFRRRTTPKRRSPAQGAAEVLVRIRPVVVGGSSCGRVVVGKLLMLVAQASATSKSGGAFLLFGAPQSSIASPLSAEAHHRGWRAGGGPPRAKSAWRGGGVVSSLFRRWLLVPARPRKPWAPARRQDVGWRSPWLSWPAPGT